MNRPEERVSLRSELVRVIQESGARVPADLDDDAPLISAGVLDSTALFALALWVEEQVAPDLDLTTFDLADEWDTITKLLAFIEQHAKRPV